MIIITSKEHPCCPLCGGVLRVRGTCFRKSRGAGSCCKYRLRVMECCKCHKTHREIPDELIPYKRYDAASFCNIAGEDSSEYTCETSTWQRMRAWLSWFFKHAADTMKSLAASGLSLYDNVPVGDSLRMTKFFVRIVVNSGRWVQHRSAVNVV